MGNRFSASIIFEVTVDWDQDLQSFVASGQRKGGQLHWQIGGERHYPTLPEFTAGLRAVGVTLGIAEANRLIADQEASKALAARKRQAA